MKLELLRLLHLTSTVLLVSHAVASPEGDALHAFKLAVSDPKGMLETWDPTLVDPCTWLYITCDGDNYVTRIDLANASLTGTLVSELGVLQRLHYLELFNNSLRGTIPKELGALKQLITFDLQNNALTGTLPTTIAQMTSLTFLRLGNNKLHGEIPREMITMSSLQLLDLSYNNLSGPVPQGGSFSKFSLKSFQGNPGLCGPVVKRPCT